MKTNQLLTIQTSLKCPKNQKNSFWWYNYRSCEDILETVKPLLTITNTTLTVCDDIIEVWGRIYVKATATLRDADTWEIIDQNTAFAREEESQKGMQASQLTGATSSYARKYALNWLFLLDDVKDADATNTHWKEEKKATSHTDDKWNPNGWFQKAIKNVEYMKKCWGQDEFIMNIKQKYTVDDTAEKQLREAYVNAVVKPTEPMENLPFE